MSERERFLKWYESEFGSDEEARLERPVAWASWQAACPDGWQCVPVVPTQEMVNAFNSNMALRYAPANEIEYRGRHCWKSMLLAAPERGEQL